MADGLLKKIEEKNRGLKGRKSRGYLEVSFAGPEESDAFRQQAQGILSRAGVKKGGSALDVGCGTGSLTIAFSALGFRTSGVDVNGEFVKLAKLKARYLKRRASFFRCGAERLPFKDNSFDFVFSKTTLEHVRDLEASVAEMLRVCKPGGRVYIEVPNYFWIWEGHYRLFMPPLLPKSLFRIYARLAGKDPEFINHINYLTPWRMERLFKKLGATYRNLYFKRLGRILLEKKLDEISPYFRSRHGRAINALSRLGLNGIIYGLMKAAGFYPSLIYLLEKGGK